jgi:hypothetical protein
MQYAVKGKFQAYLGDIITFNYKNPSGSDMLSKNFLNNKTATAKELNPTVLFLTEMRSEKGTILISGFNLNYIINPSNQLKLIELIRSFKNAKVAYKAAKKYLLFAQAYRVYNEKFAISIRKVELQQKHQIPVSKRDRTNANDPRNDKQGVKPISYLQQLKSLDKNLQSKIKPRGN